MPVVKYMLFSKRFLWPELTEPPHLPYQLAQFRLVDMFTTCTKAYVKEKIVLNYANPDKYSADCYRNDCFRDGPWLPKCEVNCSYRGTIWHSGRDGERCTATLYYNKPDFVTDMDHDRSSMKEYCKSKDVCKRQVLLKHFDCDEVVSITLPCLYCVICASNCSSCDVCMK